MTTRACRKTNAAYSFKYCNNCHTQWENLDAFIEDPGIRIVGYMPTFDELPNGLFLFNHSCGTTLACRVGLFAHLYDGPIYAAKKTGQSECPGYCMNESDFSPCPVECNCAFVRETLQILKMWPKYSRRDELMRRLEVDDGRWYI